MRQYRIIDIKGNSVPQFPVAINAIDLAFNLAENNSNYSNGIAIRGENDYLYPVIAILNDVIMIGDMLIN